MKPLGIIMTTLLPLMPPIAPTNSKTASLRRVSLPDAFDDYINWIIFWLLLSAINLSMEAGAYLVGEDLGQWLHAWAQFPSRAGGGVILVAVALFLWRRRQAGWRRVDRRAFLDSSTMDNLKRSAFVTFLVTLPTVVLLDIVTNHTTLPADFFIKLPGIALTATFSLCFFFLNRNPADELDEEEAVS